MKLRYAGPGPHDDGQGGIVRPGDVWDWPEEPDWGPWEPAGDDGAVTDSAPQATQPPAGGGDSPGAGQDATDADGSAAAADAGKGM